MNRIIRRPAAVLFLTMLFLAVVLNAPAAPRSAGAGRGQRASRQKAVQKAGEAPTSATTAVAATKAAAAETTTRVEVRESTVAAELAHSDTKTTKPAPALVVRVPLGGDLSERGGGLRFLGPRRRSLKDALELCVRLRDDAAVSTVVLELSAFEVGTASVQELRQAVGDMRRRGKHVIAVLNDDAQSAYLLASGCDEIVMPPSNALMLLGAKVESYFLRSLLEKVGARAEIIHMGQYKSYGEMFTEDDFTTPARQNMQAIVDDAYHQLVGAIADGRRMTTPTVDALIDRGPLTAQEALAAHLVDRLAYREEVVEEFRRDGRKVVAADDYTEDRRKPDDVNIFALMAALSKGATPQKDLKYPQVAVVYAVGPIVPGSSDSLDLSTAEEIAADDYLKILDDIEKDAAIKGVILRVNSPGGSALASDVLFRRIVELGRKKPVIASMGDVAASGGYYISMAAGKLIADPMTVTGSIGVVGGKLDLAGTYGRLGVHKTTIARGRFANLFSETGGFSPEQRASVEKIMRQTYDEFVAKAARQRGMTTQALEQLAQGRVYTGAQARDVRLVDALGGFGDAVQEMKHLIGLQPEDKVSLVAFPKELTLLDVLQKAMGANAQLARSGGADPLQAAALSAADLAKPLAQALALGRILAAEHVALMLPLVLNLQ
jgi:protease-4